MTLMTGRYSELGDIELCGNSESLIYFANFITSIVNHNIFSIDLGDCHEITPYDGCLTRIELRLVGDFGLLIYRDKDLLVIHGPRENLRAFASEIIDLAEIKHVSNYHVHIEYYEGHYYLSNKSNPIVIILQK